MRFRAASAICAISIVACTPSSWKQRPKVRAPRAGSPIDMYCAKVGECTASRSGVVTVRGGDPVDWYTVAIPALAAAGCRERLRVELRWEVPRDESELSLSLWQPGRDGGRGHYSTKRWDDDDHDNYDGDDDEEHDQDEDLVAGSKQRLVIEASVAGGTHFIGVHARGSIGAGEYTLTVANRFDVCLGGWTGAGWQAAGDVIQPRPENLVAPRSNDALVSVTSAGMSRQPRDGIPAHEPTFVIDASDPRIAVGARGVIVDHRGSRVRHGEFEVFSTWSPEGSDVRFASARFVDPGWFRRKIETGWDYWFATITSGSSGAAR